MCQDDWPGRRPTIRLRSRFADVEIDGVAAEHASSGTFRTSILRDRSMSTSEILNPVPRLRTLAAVPAGPVSSSPSTCQTCEPRDQRVGQYLRKELSMVPFE